MTRASRWLAAAALALPPVGTAWFIAAFGVNAAYADHLRAVELFDAASRGELTAPLAFKLANEHRIFFPRLLFVTLGRFTAFNNVTEMYVGLALMVACAVVLFAAYRREWNGAAAALPWFVPAGVVLFTWRQHELLMRGDALPTTYMVVLGVLVALLLLDRADAPGPAFAGALAAATFASFSYMNGLLVWPIGALMLAPVPRRPPRSALLAVWLAVGAAVVVTYFHGYAKPPQHPSILYFTHVPLAALEYFLVACGGAIASTRAVAGVAGAVLCVLYVVAIRAGIRSWRAGERIPWGIWLIVFCLLSQVMITLGRSGIGVDQALSSRYAPFSMLGVIGAWFVLSGQQARASANPRGWRAALLAVAAAGIVLGVLEGIRIGPLERQNRLRVAYLLQNARYEADETLRVVSVSRGVDVRKAAGILERLRLNVFAAPPIDPAALPRAPEQALVWLDFFNQRQVGSDRSARVADGAVWLAGWAVDPVARRCPAALFVVIDDGRLVVPALLGGDRGDVAAAFGVPAYRQSGFTATFSSALLSPGSHTITFTVVSADGQRAMDAPPPFTIVRVAGAVSSAAATPSAFR